MQQDQITYIVGWNDILGFKSVMEINNLKYVEDEIVARLDDVRKNAIQRSLAASAKHADVEEVINNVEMRVVSDTLAVVCPVKQRAWAAWIVFMAYSATLHEELFNIGLPLRGAVSCGGLCVRDWGVFGEPVVRAHKVCEALELSACVLLPDAVDAMHAAFCVPEARPRQALFAEWYDVPVKSPGKTRRQLVQLLNKSFFLSIKGAAIRDYACDKFTSHGKSIDDPSVQRKLDHTISFLQWNQWLWEHGVPGDMLKTMQQHAASRM